MLRILIFILTVTCSTQFALAQTYAKNALRLGIAGGLNLGGEEATVKYASYTLHPFGMVTMEYFIANQFALTGSLFAGTLAAELEGRDRFPGYGTQVITSYDTKYYGLAVGADYALPMFWDITPLARCRLGSLVHHTRVMGEGGFDRRLSKSALIWGFGGGFDYSVNRELSLMFAFDVFLTNSDELDGLISGDKNDALVVFSLGLNFLLRPGDSHDRLARDRDWYAKRTPRHRDAMQTPTVEEDEYSSVGASARGDAWRGIAIEQTPPLSEEQQMLSVEQGGALNLSTSLFVTPIHRFADLERDPSYFTLTARQNGREAMQLKCYAEILCDGRTIFQGITDVVLKGREQRFSARDFLDFSELFRRVRGNDRLPRGNYVVRVSTVAWDHELSSLSQAKFLNMDLRPIFGRGAEDARKVIMEKAVDVAAEGRDALVVNFFDVARQSAFQQVPKPGSDEEREPLRLLPRSLASAAHEEFLANGIRHSFTEALQLRQLVSTDGQAEHLKVVVAEIYFPLDEERLSEEARTLLDNVARHLNQHPALFAEIRGYANDVGDAAWNATLARKRAQRVIEYLIRQNTSSYRLELGTVDDYLAPVRPGEDSRAGRKVEVVLINKGM